MVELRDYQLRTIEAARQKYREGKRSILIVMPTGGGKTATMSALVQGAHGKGSRVAWIVHREELIQQAVDALRAVGMPVGIIAPWAPRVGATVQVCSVQTLLARDTRPPADVLVWDEAHHAAADTYARVARDYEGSLRFGLTATPDRSDGVGLGNIFDCIVVACQAHELVSRGYLVHCNIVGPARKTKHLCDNPLHAYQTMGAGRQCIVFASSLKAGKAMADAFNAAGYPSEWIDGATDKDQRRSAIAKYRAGRLRVLINYAVFTEGFDAPETSCVILARGFSSHGAYLQAVGRGMRPAPGKKDCLVIDLRGAANEHGLPEDPRKFSLEGRAIQTKEGLHPITQCPECGRVFRSEEFKDATCPRCGYVRPGRQDPAIRREILATIRAADPDTQRTEFLRRHLFMCRANGWKLARALIVFKKVYKTFPSEQMKRNAGWYAVQARAS